jgi:predicted transcriptional regulator
MDKPTRYSAVPVGQDFMMMGITYTKTSKGRAFIITNKGKRFIRVKKHEPVCWINAYPSQIEA